MAERSVGSWDTASWAETFRIQYLDGQWQLWREGRGDPDSAPPAVQDANGVWHREGIGPQNEKIADGSWEDVKAALDGLVATMDERRVAWYEKMRGSLSG
jgi:hypothetical protein